MALLKRMQFINVHRLVGETALNRLDQLEANQIQTFGASRKTLTFADRDRVRQAVSSVNNSVNGAFRNQFTSLIGVKSRHC